MTATKDRLLLAAEARFLLKGYSATTVDEICRDAGATKGAFFHHFKSKKDIVKEALDRHAERRFETMMQGTAHGETPRTRVLAYVERMHRMARSSEQPACLVAAMTLELSDVHPDVQIIVNQAFARWTRDLTTLLMPAMASAAPTAESVAHLIMSSYQGALIVARAKRNPLVIDDAMRSLSTYLETVLASDAPVHHLPETQHVLQTG